MTGNDVNERKSDFQGLLQSEIMNNMQNANSEVKDFSQNNASNSQNQSSKANTKMKRKLLKGMNIDPNFIDSLKPSVEILTKELGSVHVSTHNVFYKSTWMLGYQLFQDSRNYAQEKKSIEDQQKMLLRQKQIAVQTRSGKLMQRQNQIEESKGRPSQNSDHSSFQDQMSPDSNASQRDFKSPQESQNPKKRSYSTSKRVVELPIFQKKDQASGKDSQMSGLGNVDNSSGMESQMKCLDNMNKDARIKTQNRNLDGVDKADQTEDKTNQSVDKADQTLDKADQTANKAEDEDEEEGLIDWEAEYFSEQYDVTTHLQELKDHVFIKSFEINTMTCEQMEDFGFKILSDASLYRRYKEYLLRKAQKEAEKESKKNSCKQSTEHQPNNPAELDNRYNSQNFGDNMNHQDQNSSEFHSTSKAKENLQDEAHHATPPQINKFHADQNDMVDPHYSGSNSNHTNQGKLCDHFMELTESENQEKMQSAEETNHILQGTRMNNPFLQGMRMNNPFLQRMNNQQEEEKVSTFNDANQAQGRNQTKSKQVNVINNLARPSKAPETPGLSEVYARCCKTKVTQSVGDQQMADSSQQINQQRTFQESNIGLKQTALPFQKSVSNSDVREESKSQVPGYMQSTFNNRLRNTQIPASMIQTTGTSLTSRTTGTNGMNMASSKQTTQPSLTNQSGKIANQIGTNVGANQKKTEPQVNDQTMKKKGEAKGNAKNTKANLNKSNHSSENE
eukprot:403331453